MLTNTTDTLGETRFHEKLFKIIIIIVIDIIISNSSSSSSSFYKTISHTKSAMNHKMYVSNYMQKSNKTVKTKKLQQIYSLHVCSLSLLLHYYDYYYQQYCSTASSKTQKHPPSVF